MTSPKRDVDPVGRVFAADAVGTQVAVRGWVVKTRSSGGILFVQLRDRTGMVQATGKRDVLGAATFDALEHVQVDGTLQLRGSVAEDRRAPGGRELRIESAEVIDPGLPFPIFQEQTEEFRLDKRHLVIRSPEFTATFRLKDSCQLCD